VQQKRGVGQVFLLFISHPSFHWAKLIKIAEYFEEEYEEDY